MTDQCMNREEIVAIHAAVDEADRLDRERVWPARRVLTWREELAAEKVLDAQIERMGRRR